MGLSTLTAMSIATNDVVCQSRGPHDNGKYEGWILHNESKRFRPLINSDARYESENEAVEAMEDIVSDVKKWYTKEVESSSD